MSPERWKKVEAIFNAALVFDRDERDDFVRRACGEDPELVEQVKLMLANDEDSESFFESGVLGLLEPPPNDSSTLDENIGRQIGAYRLVRQLGRGGMGAVYLAERADREFRQQVAIKLIKRGMDTELVLKRFRHERQILADLNHPHIARLLDGGTTTDGLPYFVMEYIDGQSILEYCNQHQLSIKERLRLFLQVCWAVRFAHQKTIIHRDIKPSNILVTNDGNAKLLDFGIAKILGGDRSEETFENTTPTLRLLTPDYASPEHLQGLQVTQVSDIYSLGILLYELLTDHHPFRSLLPESDQTQAFKKGKKPERPSQIIFVREQNSPQDKEEANSNPEIISANRKMTLKALHEELRGNLDVIVLRAINENPSLRHQSVDQLIKEIEQHLEGKILPSDLLHLSAPVAAPGMEVDVFSSEKGPQPNPKTAFEERMILSPRQKGIKQAVILIMSGVIGTPLIAFLSLEFGLKPTWMLIFAVLTILGGLMRLTYALIFEASLSKKIQNKSLQNINPELAEKEIPLLNNSFLPPGSWMEDTSSSIENRAAVQIQKNSDKNKEP